MGKGIVVRENDPAAIAWRRAQLLEDERDAASWLAVPFRMFVNVSFLGTLLQMEFAGMPLKAALASAIGGGFVFALVWLVLTYWYGEDLNQMFLRSLLIVSLISLWFAHTLLVSPR